MALTWLFMNKLLSSVTQRIFYTVSKSDLRTSDVDCSEIGVAVGSLASAKSDCFRLVGI